MQRRPSLPPEPNKALCPSCNKQKSPNEAYCDTCGTRACVNCSHILSPGSRICPICGWEDRKWKPPVKGHALSINAPDSPKIPGVRSDFICPNCKIKITPKSGYCPNCGYLIDVEQEPDMVADFTAPKTRDTQQFQPPSQPFTVHEQAPGKLDVKVGHSCPQCGNKINPGLDRCPNCGHIGPMQHDIAQQQPSTIPPKAVSFTPQATPQTPVQEFQPVPEVAQGRSCPSCGSRISMDSRICPHCSANVGSRRPAPPVHGVTAMERAQSAASRPISPIISSGAASHPVSPTISSGAASHPVSPTISSGAASRPISPTISSGAASHPVSPVVSSGSSSYSAESATPRVASIPLPDKQRADKDKAEKPRERKYKEKRRGGFPIGLLAAIIIVAVALIGMVIYVASQEWQPPVPSISDNAFKISDITSSSITENSATITWTTDIPATSQVQLCEGDVLCLPWTDNDKKMVTSHSVTVTDLKEDTLYHVTVRSLDEEGNEVISEKDVTFTTLGESSTAEFSISGVEVTGITESSATIKWKTNREATSQLEYGTTTDYGMKSVDNNMIKDHNILLTDLEPNTNYYYRITVNDISNIEAIYESDGPFTTSAHIATGINIGNRAPDFTLDQLSGGQITLSDLQGKIVMVNFWYTTCAPCIAEMPDIQEVFDTWAGGKELVILAVNRKDDLSSVQSFVNNQGINFTVLLDPIGEVNTLYSITSWPTTYFIDSEGIIRNVKNGSFASKDEILTTLETLE